MRLGKRSERHARRDLQCIGQQRAEKKITIDGLQHHRAARLKVGPDGGSRASGKAGLALAREIENRCPTTRIQSHARRKQSPRAILPLGSA